MTVLLIFLMILAAVAVAMLAFRLILELWRRCGHLSKRSEQIRSEYWRIIMVTMVRIILIVFGTWALYCFFQFREGDSWAAMLLAAVTLAIFSGIIIFFTIRIFYLASKAQKLQGGVDELYEHQPWMKKYGFFYNQFKSPLWWFFVPIITMSVIRAFFLVFAAKSGLIQAIGILSAEGIFLFVLFWRRPYDGRGANVVNAMIAITRVLSIVCILIFVQELGIAVLLFYG
jgi:Transient receptor potential (TRP) ion channel